MRIIGNKFGENNAGLMGCLQAQYKKLMGNDYKIAEWYETCQALINDEYESSASTNYIFPGRVKIFW